MNTGAWMRANELLLDAETMLKDIERNRAMPSEAQALQQYISLGREISMFLTDVDEGAYRDE